MPDLQELITRGRFVMAEAPERLKTFQQVNGRRSTTDIAALLRRHVNNVRRDLTKLADAELIQPRLVGDKPLRKDGFPVYEKVPLVRTIPLHYFSSPSRLPSRGNKTSSASIQSKRSTKPPRPKQLPVPSEHEVLDIAKNGEGQIHEFKGQGTTVQKITREIAAMLNTRQGGIVFYGIDDDGVIEGSDLSQQKLDQPLQNSIRNSVSPAATVRLHTVQVMGSSIIVIIVPPWNRKDVYQHDGRILIRRGTNVFAARPEELKRLHSGMYVI